DRCTESSSSRARCFRSARPTPLARSGSSTFWTAVSHGNRAGSWNMNATRRPPVETVPEVGASSPATNDSSVLLPHPDAPIRHTNSPGATDSDTPSSATTWLRPLPKALGTSSILIAAVFPASGRPVVGACPLSALCSVVIGSPQDLTCDSPAACSNLLTGPRSKMPLRLVLVSSPTALACWASVASDDASGSLVNVISLNASGRMLDLMPLPDSVVSSVLAEVCASLGLDLM